MTSATMAPAAVAPFLAWFAAWFAPRSDATPEPPHEADRNRRAFVQEMLSRNPDAFASEHDVHCMMNLYPGRF